MKTELGEKGAALVVALLVLLTTSVLAAAIVVTSVTETRISSYQLMNNQALGVAEAGIEEVISRMSLDPADGEYIGDATYPLRPDWGTTVLLTNDIPPDEPPRYYVKSIQMSKPGNKLFYTTDDPDDPKSLVVHHKTQGGQIWFCNLSDRSLYLESPDHIGFPVEVIEVTGRKGLAKRRVIAEVVEIVGPRYVPTGAAFWWRGSIVKSDGIVEICGHNHHGNIDLSTGLYDPSNCSDFHLESCQFPYKGIGDSSWTWGIRHPDNCDPAGCEVAVKSVIHPSAGTQQWDNIEAELYGNPAVEYPKPPFPRLWELLGYADEAQIVGALDWQEVHTGDTLVGGAYVVNDPLFEIEDTLGGHGILWVKGSKRAGSADNYLGNLTIKFGADYTFTGLVYVEGNLTSESGSTFRTLGTVLVRTGIYEDLNPNATSGAVGPINGRIVSCYSSEAVANEVVGISGRYEFLSWREK